MSKTKLTADLVTFTEDMLNRKLYFFLQWKLSKMLGNTIGAIALSFRKLHWQKFVNSEFE